MTLSPDQEQFTWDLADLYPSDAAWAEARSKLAAQSQNLNTYKGTLGKGADQLLTVLNAISQIRKEAYRLASYASLKADEDVRIAANQERLQTAQTLLTDISARTAWFSPEILALGANRIKDYQTAEPALQSRFGMILDDILRAAPHTLGAEAEAVLAEAGNVLGQPDTIYSQLANGELPFKTVKLSTGEEVRLDQAAYGKYRQSLNRADRKLVFDTYWPTFSAYQGTIGATLTAHIRGEIFNAKSRKFPNTLAAATFADNMPESVYRTLINQANQSLPTLHRYLKLRKTALGITDDLRYYDSYPPIFDLPNPQKFSLDDLKRITLDVTKPFGAEYTSLLEKGFQGRWMHVYPRQGKANGAYMNGSAYDVHPYLLLNNHDDYDTLSTFAHEWGHAVHTLLTSQSQPFEKADYSTFIAETASIANELLLNDALVAQSKSKEEKLYYLGEALELIRTTFFRQTMFAEFQLLIHAEVEKTGSLSGERMTDLYCGLLKKYHGDSDGVMKIDPAYCIEWAFIPHFYYGFYVYQYATSMAGAALLTDALASDGEIARERFITMLKAGGSDYPYELYKRAGLDMATAAPYQALIARMNRIMDQIDMLQSAK